MDGGTRMCSFWAPESKMSRQEVQNAALLPVGARKVVGTEDLSHGDVALTGP